MRKFTADFETVVWDNADEQTETEVWAAAWCEIGKTEFEDVIISNNINDFFDFFFHIKEKRVIVYFHNLGFDASFILYYLHHELKFHEAIEDKEYKNKKTGKTENIRTFVHADKDMPDRSYKYSISDMGLWYTVTIKYKGKIIELRDSLKLINAKVSDIAKSFDCKNQKLSIDYKSHMHAYEEITEEEQHYIANDVLVMSEALDKLFKEDITQITIGASSLKHFKDYWDKTEYSYYFPDLTEFEIDEDLYGSRTADEYIRKAYKGAFCYLNPKYKEKVFNQTCSADVNSLYPSNMHGESDNYYPIGAPHFCKGVPSKKLLIDKERYTFIRFECSFDIKEGMLPTVQIKNNLRYMFNEWLTTSRIKNSYGQYVDKIYGFDGKVKDVTVQFTMTVTDFRQFLNHYNVYNLKFYDYVWFYARKGIFDEYINKYMDMKINNNGNTVKRTIAKLMLNSLYGKFSTSCCSSFKVFDYDSNEYDNLYTIEEYDKKAGYIPIGAAITSYSRNFIIKYAQRCGDKFIYCDTDSLHLIGKPEDFENEIPIHETALLNFKWEGEYDVGYYYRQKFYVEREKGKEDYKIAMCGLPMICKDDINDQLKSGKLKITDLTKGFKISGKLLPKRVKGGIVLVDTDFQIR